MLAKITSKNQITIPKNIMSQLPRVTHFDLTLKEGVVEMRPVITYATDLDAIREKVAKLGISDDSVQEAVRWARSK
jgi:hypothetical protein